MAATAVLTRLRGKAKVRNFLVFDIEARQWVHPYAIGAYDGVSYTEFVEDGYGCIKSMLGHLLTKHYAGFWFYAHNGGNYDFLFIIRALLKMRDKYRVELTPAGSAIVRMDVFEVVRGVHRPDCNVKTCKGCEVKSSNKKLQKWTFVDSAKLMPLPLADLGEAFGITKKIKLHMSYDDLAKPENRAAMSEYLRTDCISTYQAIHLFQTKILELGGQVGVTLPSTSLDLFRRAYQRDDIYTNRHFLHCPASGVNGKEDACHNRQVNKLSPCLHDFVRRGYFGGPAQIFRMAFVGKEALKNRNLSAQERALFTPGHEVAKMYDINSHYPGMMLEPMPVSEAVEFQGLTEEVVYKNARSFTGMVECKVEIPEDCYLPPLPVEVNGKLMFPAGRLFGVWDAAELALLKKVGGKIVQTYRSIWFDQAPIFVDFVREMYKFRNKKQPGWTKGMDWIAKILLNSSYGKYAMREDRQRILMNPDLSEGLKCIDFESDVWSENIHVSPAYVVPQLSAHITALARVKLWKLLFDIVSQGGRIYYTDTDSVVCSGVELETGPGLGALKLEAIIHRAQFVLPKLYLIETEDDNKKKQLEATLRIKSKGMGPGIRTEEAGDDPYGRELSEEEFINLTRKGIPITRKRLTRLREGLRDYAKKGTEFPRVVAAPKGIQSTYDKRTVLPDLNTAPLVINHW